MMKASLIVLIALVAVASAAHDFTKCKAKKGQSVLLADVGSSGTRFYLIGHANSVFTIYEGPKSAAGWGRLAQTDVQTMQGQLDDVYKKLHTLIKTAKGPNGGFGLATDDAGANEIIACAPLFIGATAGMRGVFNKNPTAAKTMIANTKAADKKLRPQTTAATVFEIISGPMEGYFGFRSAIAQNVEALDLKTGTVGKKGARITLSDAEKMFYMEIGGASVQFANIVKDKSAAGGSKATGKPNKQNNKKPNKKPTNKKPNKKKSKFLELASKKQASFVEVDSKYLFSRGNCIKNEKFTLMSNSCLGCAGNRMTANALAVVAKKKSKTSGCIAPGVVVKDHGSPRGICYPSTDAFSYDCSDLNDEKLSPGGETKPLGTFLKGTSNTITGKPSFASCCADVRDVFKGAMEFDTNAGKKPSKTVPYAKFFDAVTQGIKDAKQPPKHVFINNAGVAGNMKVGSYKFSTDGFITVKDMRAGFVNACEKKTPYNGPFDFNRCVPLAIVDETIAGNNHMIKGMDPANVKFGSAGVGWEVGAAEVVYELLIKKNAACKPSAFVANVLKSELSGFDRA